MQKINKFAKKQWHPKILHLISFEMRKPQMRHCVNIRIPGEKMLGEQSDIWLWNNVF